MKILAPALAFYSTITLSPAPAKMTFATAQQPAQIKPINQVQNSNEPTDIEFVNNFISSEIDKLILEPQGLFKYNALFPSVVDDYTLDRNQGGYAQQYDWDTHYLREVLLHINQDKYGKTVIDSLLNFLSFEDERTGYIPRTIGLDKFYDFPDHHKPFLFQSLMLLQEHGISLDFLKKRFSGYTWKRSLDELINNDVNVSDWKTSEYKKLLANTTFVPIERLEKYLDYLTYRKKRDLDYLDKSLIII